MVDQAEPEGSARLHLVSGVPLLHPEDAVFEAMLEGWYRQQRGGRRLGHKTVSERQALVRDFMSFTGEYPWRWTAAHMDDWSSHLVAVLHRKPSTIRHNQSAIRLFCDFLINPHYRWAEECELRFGTHPVQICHEWNTLAHLVDYEGGEDRRPFTRSELQSFFDYCDDRVELAVRRGRKGALHAYRDATLFKVIYGWGLRRTEASRLDLADFHRNPRAPEFGRYGGLQVRYGKRTRGSAYRRREVLSVMDWAVEAVAVCSLCGRARPCFGAGTTTPRCTNCSRAKHPCRNCGKVVRARVRTPDGYVCQNCFGKDPITHRPCFGCGQTGPIWHHGLCPRCACQHRVRELVTGSDGTVRPGLEAVVDALAAASDPAAVLRWLRPHTKAAAVLAQLGTDGCPVEHDTLDQYGANRAVRYLRGVLVTAGALPQRDERMVALE